MRRKFLLKICAPIGAVALAGTVAGCHPSPTVQSNDAEPVSNSVAAPLIPSPKPTPEPSLPTNNAIAPAPAPHPLPSPAAASPNQEADWKTPKAAEHVVDRYATLLSQKRYAAARQLWGDGGRDSGLTEAEFAAAYTKYARIQSEVGIASGQEGAAGSSYIRVPLRLYGTLANGRPFNLVGPVTLRRVNDVPGSTERQRRWHISQSDLRPRP